MDDFRWQRFLYRQQLRGYTGTVPFLTSDYLPLDTEDAIVGLLPGDEQLSLMDLGLTTAEWRIELDGRVEQIHERVHDRFQKRVKALALLLLLGTITLLVWHRRMRDEVKNHVLQQALLGGRGTIRDIKRVDGLVRRETDYLARFADEIAREGVNGRTNPRAVLYGGTARGVFYREREADLPEGYVIEYVSRDDDVTCAPCDSAVGFYLPGEGPYPGEVCLGRSHCRCIRLLHFDPPLYAQLKART